MITRKQSIAFPEVATIRKGAPKVKKTRPDGSTYETVGPDLGKSFRIVFAPGTDAIFHTWMQIHKTDQPERIRAMIPFPSVWSAWEFYNEAYNAGRLIARADGDKYLVLRDPVTGEYIVRDGLTAEGHVKKFTPGEKITYDANNKHYELPMKSTGRLRVWIPELMRMVFLTLKTTSFYDCQNITANLAAVQGVADALNGGNAAGIPLWIYRTEREITWNKPGGSAQRVKKWLIQIEVDPAFAGAAIERMTKFALTGGQAPAMLPTGPIQPLEQEIAGELDPDAEEEDDAIEGEGQWIEQEQEEEPGMVGAAIDLGGQIVMEEDPQQQPAQISPRSIIEGAPRDESGKLARPMTPRVLRAALAVKAEKLEGRSVTPKQTGLAAMLVEQVFAGQEDVKKIRHSVINYLFGQDSLSAIQPAELHALLDWLAPEQQKDSGEYIVNAISAKELTSLWAAALTEAGQQELF